MSERDKNTARDIIEAYRRRQQLTQNAILVITFVVILLIAVGVVLLMRYTAPTPAPLETETQAPEPTETVPASPTATETPPSDSPVPVLSETPVVEETPISPGTTTYEVQEGDTLATIAERFNIEFQTLLSLNPDIDPDLIVVGQQIVIPAVQLGGGSATPIPEGFSGLVEYEVVAGDTVLDIANRFNSSVAAIVAENGLENANDIQAGIVLQIPVNVGEAEEEAATQQAITETANP